MVHTDILGIGAGSRSKHSNANIIEIEIKRVNGLHDESKRIHLNLCFFNAKFNLTLFRCISSQSYSYDKEDRRLRVYKSSLNFCSSLKFESMI